MTNVRTTAIVDIQISNNVWWTDAFQFGCTAVGPECCLADVDTSWSFTSKTFLLDIKASNSDSAALLSLSTANNRITVTDAANRILQFSVTDLVIRAALVPGQYPYDLVMVDPILGGQRTLLMQGTLTVTQGVTIED